MAIKNELDETMQSDLEKMIASGVQEGQQIDFKQEYPSQWNDKAKHSLAADAVAFANANGGTLIFGMTQGTNAEAVSINPQSISSTDDERVKLHSFLMDLVEPRLPGVQTHAVPVTVNGISGYVMLVRIPQSWVGPHRSKMGNHFFVRDGPKNKALDIPEIRSQFLRAEDRNLKLKDFRADRLSNVLSGDTPFKLVPGAVLVVHIVPIQAVLGQVAPDVVQYSGLRRQIPIIAASGGAAYFKLNLDGAVGARTVSSGSTHGYTLIFRNGFIESTWVQTTNNPTPHAKPALPSGSFEGYLKTFVVKSIEEISYWGSTGPILVMLSLLRANGMRLAHSRDFSGDEHLEFDREVLAFPEIQVIPENGDLMRQMRPLLDVVWQAAGGIGSPNFNQTGDWVPPTQ
jgi:hypothetical protein